jgi:predicted TPR repeat methyltransferase
MPPAGLTDAPADFFMTLRDVAFWGQSALADAKFARARGQHGAASAFDRLYAGSADPFCAEVPHYRYQRRKYQSLLSMLPRRPYRNALDIGCGLGTFARMLAPHAGSVLGTDISGTAVERARALSVAQANLHYACLDVLNDDADVGRFDLIVLADTLYYIEPLADTDLAAIARRTAGLLAPGGLMLLVNHHFFGFDGASRLTRRIHARFRHASALQCAAEHRRAFFLATLLEARPAA